MTAALVLVCAMGHDRAIGVDNRMPWHLPEDLRHFKATTLGKPVIMGRKTFDSIGRALPGRRNLVVTRQTDWLAEGCEVFHSLEAAIAATAEVEEACVIGGADIYRQALPLAQRLVLTEVDLAVPGADAFFPAFDPLQWQETSRAGHVAASGVHYAFVEYRRR